MLGINLASKFFILAALGHTISGASTCADTCAKTINTQECASFAIATVYPCSAATVTKTTTITRTGTYTGTVSATTTTTKLTTTTKTTQPMTTLTQTKSATTTLAPRGLECQSSTVSATTAPQCSDVKAFSSACSCLGATPATVTAETKTVTVTTEVCTGIVVLSTTVVSKTTSSTFTTLKSLPPTTKTATTTTTATVSPTPIFHLRAVNGSVKGQYLQVPGRSTDPNAATELQAIFVKDIANADPFWVNPGGNWHVYDPDASKHADYLAAANTQETVEVSNTVVDFDPNFCRLDTGDTMIYCSQVSLTKGEIAPFTCQFNQGLISGPAYWFLGGNQLVIATLEGGQDEDQEQIALNSIVTGYFYPDNPLDKCGT